MIKALHEGPYGKCVYDSDNDVCACQTVNIEFEERKYVPFTLSPFVKNVCPRENQIYGTMGK